MLVVLLLFQIPKVQTFFGQQVLNQLSKKNEFDLSVDKVKISWLDRADFSDILIKDDHGDTLIYTHQLEVNYRIWNLINGRFLNIEELSSSIVVLNLVKYDSASKLNLTEFINSFKKESAGTKKRKSTRLDMDEVNIADLTVRLDDKSKLRKPDRMDFSHFNFNVPGLNLSRLQVKSDTISGGIMQMMAEDQFSGFAISDLVTTFRLTGQSLSLDDLELKTPTSYVSDSLEFFFNGLDDLAYFVDSVSFVFHLNNTIISQKDAQLITGINKLKSDIAIDGIFWGTVGDFNIEDARIAIGENTFFEGGVSCFGLPDINKTFILADIIKSRLLPSDLEPYLGAVSENLKRMGRIDFTGSFAGFVKDFVARGDFYTDQGSVHTDINIKIPDDPSYMAYTGSLELKSVNVGAFFKNDVIQRINLNATIKGVGIKPDNADFDLNALIFQSGLKGYVYDSVYVNGHFAKNFFDGSFEVKDENFRAKGNSQIDLRTTFEKLDLNIQIEKLYADRLNLTERNLFAKGHINLELNDFDLDAFTSKLSIDSSVIVLDDREVTLDSIRFIASQIDSLRQFSLAMPGFEIDIKGDFKLTDVSKDIPLMFSGYANKFRLQQDSTIYQGSESEYRINLTAKVGDVSPYLDSLHLPITLYGMSDLEASFRKSKNLNLSFFAFADSIQLNNSTLTYPSIDINGAMDRSSSSILTNFIFNSAKQRIPGVPTTEDLLIEGIWLDNQIDFTSIIKQPTTTTSIRLESSLGITQDSILLKVQPSDIEILGLQWIFNPSNQVVFTSDNVTISNLEIFDSQESIRVDGVYSREELSEINFIVEDLNVNKVNLFTATNVSGFLNGSFRLFRSDESDPFKYDGGFFLKSLKYGDLLIGDINGSSSWDPINQTIYSNVEVARENFKSIQVKGNYYPLKEYNQLDFDITFDQANLEIAKPFVEKNFSNIRGYALGELKVSGTTKDPKIIGSTVIKDGYITINYLNTNYTFNGKVNFNPSMITFTEFDLTDRKGSQARLSGLIRHNSFTNLFTDVRIQSSNFEFLNTTSLDNKLYYGSAYGTGIIDITGPLNDLNIKANVRTDRDTRLFIPVSESTNIGLEDYIAFTDLSDTTQLEIKEQRGIRGLTLDFDIEVTPDAYCELIFDIKTGDIIRGRGRGNIKLALNTDGEFNMFGPLEITEGAYNFTVPNLINKEFDVVPGSIISWYGDPYNATLNLEATYLQRASLEELKNPQDQIEAKLSDKIPFLVVLILEGNMLNPNIRFDIRFQNQIDATAQNEAELDIITGNSTNNTNSEELRRQVISLLFLKRFTPRQSFSLGAGSGTIGSSVSEFLSSQVSYLVSQIDENLEIEVNLADLNQEAFNTFQLRFAYTFLGGRLKVTRGGGFGNQEDNNQNVLNDIVGDWSVEYSLTRDGRLRAKVFRNSNQRLITSDGQQSQETGVSLRFVHSFNDLRDLLAFRREEGIRRREEEEKSESSEEIEPETDIN